MTPIGCNSASNFRAQCDSQSKTLYSYVIFSGPVSEVSRSPTLRGKSLGAPLCGAIEDEVSLKTLPFNKQFYGGQNYELYFPSV